MTTILLTTQIQRRGDLLSSEMDGETVMLDMVSGYYFSMDSVGGRIWQLLENTQTVAQLCETLQQEYEVDAETCAREVVEFLQELSKHQLINLNAN